MKKEDILIGIFSFLLILLLLLIAFLVLRGPWMKTGSQRISYSGEQETDESTSFLPKEKPSFPPSEEGYQLVFPESDLNKYLTQGLVQSTKGAENSIVRAKLTLYEGKGLLEAYWQKGQSLTAEIRVASDGKSLTLINLEVAGFGLLKGVFEKIAYDALGNVVNSFFANQEALEKIEIKPGKLILYYSL